MAKDANLALKQKQLEVEILKVEAGRADFELKILEHEANIERLRGQIVIQEARVGELKKQLSELS